MSACFAAHQPNFFPWLGYFHKIAHSSIFVILDDVQFPKSSKGTYINRTRLLLNGNVKWFTAPVNRSFSGTRTIAEMCFADAPWRKQLLHTIKHNYAQARHFRQVIEILQPLLDFPSPSLTEFNIHAIKMLCEYLGLDTSKLLLASSLNIQSQGTERLRDLGQRLGLSRYLCGGGASGYQNDELLHASGIALTYQKFAHPTYPQVRTEIFQPGLSIIDAVANIGIDAVCDMIFDIKVASHD